MRENVVNLEGVLVQCWILYEATLIQTIKPHFESLTLHIYSSGTTTFLTKQPLEEPFFFWV